MHCVNAMLNALNKKYLICEKTTYRLTFIAFGRSQWENIFPNYFVNNRLNRQVYEYMFCSSIGFYSDLTNMIFPT